MDQAINFSKWKQLADSYDYFLFDCDGVLWVQTQTVSGSFEALDYLIDSNKTVFFLTNASARSRDQLLEKIKTVHGYQKIGRHQLYSSSYITAKYLTQHLTQGDRVFLVGELGFRNEIEAAGFIVVTEDSAQTTMTDNEFQSFKLDPLVKAVVVGIDLSFSYRRLCIASLYVQAGCKLIASNKDRNTTNRKGDYHPGGGCIVKAIETASQAKAEVMGKPSRFAFDLIRMECNLQDEPLSRFLMIGDNLQTDIKFAAANGIDSLLVLSGVTNITKCHQVIQNGVDSTEGYPTHIQPYLSYS